MSDSRFASLKTDPRFRRPRKHQSKVVLDDRFKDLLGDEKTSKQKKSKKQAARVDKYGRTVADTQEKDDLRRFYRLEGDGGGVEEPTVIDYARGTVLMESSDEGEEDDGDLPPRAPPLKNASESESDEGGFISLGAEPNDVDEIEELEVDLDENTIATLDAQVAEYAKAVPERGQAADFKQTSRLAVVNLDWDHLRAVHLYRIFSSLISPTAPLASTSTSYASKGGVNVARGRIRNVRVYPSQFGKKRMAREDKEGPPTDLFKKNKRDEDINENTVFETGTAEDYNEDALRKYQLERLRYYYAVVECDTAETAAHVYNELEGTELERSANVFDLSFVPEDMTFDDEPRDEATQLSDAPYKAVEFVTDALRHSKVKLTWDEDNPERNHILRRPLTKKEIDEADFRAYIASSSSSEDGSGDEAGKSKTRGGGTRKVGTTSKKAERDKLRMLLLGGDDDELPEGWDNAFDNKGSRGDTKSKAKEGEDSDVDMEVTFTPGLSMTKNPEDENTLERYQRKVKEKKKKKNEDMKKNRDVDGDTNLEASFDDFFGAESDSQHEEDLPSKRSGKFFTKPDEPSGSSRAELALLAVSDNPCGEPAHFDMKAVLKAEKQAKNKKSRRKSKNRNREDDVGDGPEETQADFVIDVKDDRFAAIHEDHQFAIDPTNPHFKKTKSMAALLDERSRRQKGDRRSHDPIYSQSPAQQDGRSLQSLVESIKRKGTTIGRAELGKRCKLGES